MCCAAHIISATESTDANAIAKNLTINDKGEAVIDPNSRYAPTELTGRFLDKAILEFDQTTGEPVVSLQFDEEGSKLFEKITKEITFSENGLSIRFNQAGIFPIIIASNILPFISYFFQLLLLIEMLIRGSINFSFIIQFAKSA